MAGHADGLTEEIMDLPFHPFTGLRALAVLPSGRPVWPVLGGSGEGGGSGSGDGGQSAGEGEDDGEGDGQTFTQADVDRIVANRLRRARGEYSDYDELKAKAAKLDEVEAAKKTEAEKLAERAAAAERERDEALARAQQTAIRSEIAMHAATARAIDVADVVALLAGSPDITVGKDGEVVGAAEAVKAMAKAKPHLFGDGTPAGGGFEQGTRSGRSSSSVASGADLYRQRHDKKT